MTGRGEARAFLRSLPTSSSIDIDAPCIIWPFFTNNGYGRVQNAGKSVMAHRMAYERAKGPIPDGHEVDHLCRTRGCVNPAHLEAVTHAENMRRWAETYTHCKHGHEFNEENTYWRSGGGRLCLPCNRRHARGAA